MDSSLNADYLFENVRKATRLLFEFQRRMQATMFHIKSELKLERPSGRIEINKLYSDAPRQSKYYGETQLSYGNWAWDYIYPQAMEYHLGKKSMREFDIALSTIQLIDDGFYKAANGRKEHIETYADVTLSSSWIIFVIEVKSKSSGWAKRWNRDSMEENLSKWMYNDNKVITDITKSGSHFITMKFPMQEILSESSIDNLLQRVNDYVFDISGCALF